MTRLTAFVIILALRILYHPLPAQTAITPFTSPPPLSASTLSAGPAQLISFRGGISHNKVILRWVVSKNEKTRNQKVLYRTRLTRKDSKKMYSPVIEIDPSFT